ncbi:P-loop containing nucleoside triphosphate hydrolases superfamily protein [Prunus dulcis]|uniref:P-loop containing nucleoside triphosphate hydrolases superfamily protein n=1 Tax=Prunus dulcis TaxID=3755 RepID=A0A4Y1R052_PRUDU|nr:P-loop containing nucleoside triphosphate hydrolases superfamily protein [Prunus dulcis]
MSITQVFSRDVGSKPDPKLALRESTVLCEKMAAADLAEGTLQNVLEQDSLKWVFVGGKGGVGKTTCSSILSILLSRVRSSVLIISTDPAHNLSDAFQQKFTKTPTLEVDPTVEHEDMGTDGMDNLFSELANAIPGIDEAMSFAEMLKLVQTMDYSVIVFDTAPTGHTLRLLQFPSTLEKGLAKVMSLKNKFGGLMSQMTRLFGVDDEFGEDAILGKLEGMKDVIEQVNRQFKDPDLTTFVCVCIPEFLSLYETERLVQELTKFEIDTHNIIINQVLYDEEGSESKLLKARMRMQQKYLDQFYMLYDDFNITKLPLLPEEVTGVEALKAFSRHFLTPYQPSTSKSTVETLEQRVSTLRQQLKDAEAQLEKLRKGKQKHQMAFISHLWATRRSQVSILMLIDASTSLRCGAHISHNLKMIFQLLFGLSNRLRFPCANICRYDVDIVHIIWITNSATYSSYDINKYEQLELYGTFPTSIMDSTDSTLPDLPICQIEINGPQISEEYPIISTIKNLHGVLQLVFFPSCWLWFITSTNEPTSLQQLAANEIATDVH